MSNYAVVDTQNNVLNVIVWDGTSLLGLPPSQSIHASPAPDGSVAEVGGTYNGTSFTSAIQDNSMSFAGNPSSITYTPITVTTNTFTLSQANDLIKINKTTGSATSVVLPTMTQDHSYVVTDAKGDASTNNITVTTTQGDGKINAAASVIINTNNESLTFVYDGTTTTIQ